MQEDEGFFLETDFNKRFFHLKTIILCSISFCGKRNGTQRKATDGPARLKINSFR